MGNDHKAFFLGYDHKVLNLKSNANCQDFIVKFSDLPIPKSGLFLGMTPYNLFICFVWFCLFCHCFSYKFVCIFVLSIVSCEPVTVVLS